jgi:hypothetical protein
LISAEATERDCVTCIADFGSTIEIAAPKTVIVNGQSGTEKKTMSPNDKHGRAPNGVRERIVACRKRLRRERAAHGAAQEGGESEPEIVATAPRVRAFDSRRATEDAKTVSNKAEASTSWIEHRAVFGG